MANHQDKPNTEQFSSEIDLTDVMYVELGRTSGPPKARTGTAIPKQWQPPKNESTPNRRIKRT